MKVGSSKSPLPKSSRKPAKSAGAGRLPQAVWLGLIIVLATLAAYAPAFSGGFVWDDDDWVTNNQTLRSLGGLWDIWFNPAATPQYYPLIHTGFWLEYHLWGLNPLGFHLVNVLAHLAAALLLWRLLWRLKLPGAWLAAAIFALHPLEVESVAWVTELKNVLSAVFYFLAALAYFRFAGLEGNGEPPPKNRRYYWVAFGLFLAALLCKTVTCSLPAALLLVFWWKRGALPWREAVRLLPFFVAGICFGLGTASLERHHVGAAGPDWAFTFVERCLIAGRALCFYAAKLVWPCGLTFSYPRWQIDAAVWWQWLFPAAVAGLVAGLWLARRRIGRGPLVAVLFFAGTLGPALGFINVYPMRYTLVADHFQYLAGLGLIVLAASSLTVFCDRRQLGRNARMVLAGTVLTIYASLTFLQCRVYKNAETLWTDTLNKNPGSWVAHLNLGLWYVSQEQLDLAEQQYRLAVELRPGDGELHGNLGNLLVREQQFEAARVEYQRAIQIDPKDAETHNNLGVVLSRLQRMDEAVAEYERAIFYKPDYAGAYYNLGSARAAQDNPAAAAAAYRQALRLKPDSKVFRKQVQALGVPPE